MENEECGVRSAECGKCGVWKMRAIRYAEYSQSSIKRE